MKREILDQLTKPRSFTNLTEKLRKIGILPKTKAKGLAEPNRVTAPRTVGVHHARKVFDLDNWIKLWRSIPVHHYDSMKDEIAGIELDFETILKPISRDQHPKLDAALEGIIDLASYFVFNNKAILTKAVQDTNNGEEASSAAIASSKVIIQKMFNFLLTQKPANAREANYCISPEAIRIKEQMAKYLAHYIPETSSPSDIGGIINNWEEIFRNSRTKMGGDTNNLVHEIDNRLKDYHVDECLPDILSVLYENAVEFNSKPNDPDIKIILQENPLNKKQLQLIVSNTVADLESLKGKNLEDLMRASSKHSDIDRPTAPNLKRRGLHLVKAMATFMGAHVQVDYRDERFNVVINIPKITEQEG